MDHDRRASSVSGFPWINSGLMFDEKGGLDPFTYHGPVDDCPIASNQKGLAVKHLKFILLRTAFTADCYPNHDINLGSWGCQLGPGKYLDNAQRIASLAYKEAEPPPSLNIIPPVSSSSLNVNRRLPLSTSNSVPFSSLRVNHHLQQPRQYVTRRPQTETRLDWYPKNLHE
jgi:hypothetical protein